MPFIRRLVAAALLAASGMVAAASSQAPVLKVSRSVIVHAEPDAVWHKVRDFDGLHTWHPGVVKDEIVVGHNNEVGAERLLTLRDGSTARERLLGFDAKHHRYRYKIIESALPVSGYVSVIGIKAAGKNRSKVTWSGTFRRKDTSAHPAANADDATATKTMEEVYRAGLDNLKKIVDAGSTAAP